MPIVVAEHDLIRRTGRTSRIFGPFSRLPFPAAPDTPMCRRSSRTRKPTRPDFAARTVPRFSEARPDKRALGALLAVFTGHHTMHGGDTGVPESRFILSHFLSDDSPKQTYVACIARFPTSTRQTRRTPDGRPSYLLSRDRYPIPDYRNASLMSS